MRHHLIIWKFLNFNIPSTSSESVVLWFFLLFFFVIQRWVDGIHIMKKRLDICSEFFGFGGRVIVAKYFLKKSEKILNRKYGN